jgi:DNA gyrase subunit B
MDDLKVGKIIIATDADEDGYQIRVLLFLTFYMLAPQLILNNKVFIAETPRFGLDLIDGTRVYARNDEARDELIAKYGARITKIGRYKGLGEVNKEILRETTVHPDTRTLIPVDCDLQNQTERDLIDALFGADKYHQRKSIISTVLGADVTDMLDDNALLIGEIDESDIDDGVEYETIAM